MPHPHSIPSSVAQSLSLRLCHRVIYRDVIFVSIRFVASLSSSQSRFSPTMMLCQYNTTFDSEVFASFTGDEIRFSVTATFPNAIAPPENLYIMVHDGKDCYAKDSFEGEFLNRAIFTLKNLRNQQFAAQDRERDSVRKGFQAKQTISYSFSLTKEQIQKYPSLAQERVVALYQGRERVGVLSAIANC